jgi:hypothetical protein
MTGEWQEAMTGDYDRRMTGDYDWQSSKSLDMELSNPLKLALPSLCFIAQGYRLFIVLYLETRCLCEIVNLPKCTYSTVVKMFYLSMGVGINKNLHLSVYYVLQISTNNCY